MRSLVHVLLRSYTTEKANVLYNTDSTAGYIAARETYTSTCYTHRSQTHGGSRGRCTLRYAAPYPANPPSRGDGLSGMPSSTSGA